MSDNVLVGIIIFLFCAIVIISNILRVNWNRLYCTRGLAILVRRAALTSPQANTLDFHRLQSLFPSSKVQNALVFKQLDPNRVAFRGKASGRRTGEFMRGLIHFDPARQQVVVKGYLNVTECLGCLIVIYLLSFLIHAWAVPLVCVPVGADYFMQVKRYGIVAQKAAELVATLPQPVER